MTTTITNTYIIEFRNGRIFKIADVAKVSINDAVITFLNIGNAPMFIVPSVAIEFVINFDHASKVLERMDNEFYDYRIYEVKDS